MNIKQRKDFEAWILKSKTQELIAKCGGQLSLEAAQSIIQTTWLEYIFATDEFKAEGTRDLFELWKAAQAAVVVELPEGTPAYDWHPSCGDLTYTEAEMITAIESAGGTVKQ